jgi:hypothetical protein
MSDQNHGRTARSKSKEVIGVRGRGGEARLLRREAVLRFAALGIPVAIIADDSALLSAATANFAGLVSSPDAADPAIVIRLHWNEFATAGVGFAVSVEGSCLTIEGEGILGRADALARTAECSISRAFGADREALAEIGETLLLFLLTRAGRIPIHASAIMIGDTALLLAGSSGSGKSSLALAALRQGLEVLSEDTVYVELGPAVKIWSWPGAIHVLPADAPAGGFATRIRGGRTKSAVPRAAGRAFAESAALVAIVPGAKLDLQPAQRVELVARLSPTEPGFALLRPEIGLALAALAAEGGWRLTLNSNADQAISLLRERFDGTRP